MNMIVDQDAPRNTWPNLEGKRGEIKYVLSVTLEIWREFKRPRHVDDKRIEDMMVAQDAFEQILGRKNEPSSKLRNIPVLAVDR